MTKNLLGVCFRWLVMIILPLVLAFLELSHPSGFSKHVYQTLAQHATWWKSLHIYQSFLFAAVGVGVLYFTKNDYGLWGILSKFFLWLFLVCYLVFDSTAGIAVGVILSTSEHANLDQTTISQLCQFLYNDPIVGGTGSLFSLTGSWAWSLCIISAIISLYFQNRKFPLVQWVPPLVLLAVSGYALNVGHFSPYGPIAFTTLAVASLWFEYYKIGPALEPVQNL